MKYSEEAIRLHRLHKGKVSMASKVPLDTMEDLALAYSPGVAAVSMAIANDVNESYQLTNRANTVAVISDGSAVLGLGNIGPEAAMPVNILILLARINAGAAIPASKVSLAFAAFVFIIFCAIPKCSSLHATIFAPLRTLAKSIFLLFLICLTSKSPKSLSLATPPSGNIFNLICE